MATDFLEKLRNDIISLYMPMQTFLVAEYGKPMEEHLSEWVVAHPKEFQDALRRSYAAGCDLGHTATQASSPFRSKPFGQAVVDRVYEFNFKSAKLAREVTPRDRYVVGNISSTNPDFLEPLGNMTYDEVYEGYKEQILALAEGGVDVFHISGNHIEESVIAIKVANDLTDIPVMAFNVFFTGKKGFRTMMGLDPEAASARLNETGVDVIGMNCGLVSYKDATEVIRQMRRGTDKYLGVQPDAGLAQLIKGETVYPATPDELEGVLPDWIDAGAWVLGGCCGTSLEHYRRISAVLRERKARRV